MNYLLRLVVFIVASGGLLGAASATAQVATTQAKNPMNSGPGNYLSFTSAFHGVSPEALSQNKGYENHPEMGMLFAETPCNSCYELIGNRTETTKTFIAEGTNGRDIMMQSSNAPMHYRDANGNWRTIKTQLEPDVNQKGVFAAYGQETPVSINTSAGAAFIGKQGQQFQFNNNLELVYATANGNERSLGAANWANFTAGDDGVYVKNAWPGIDIEMYVARGALKTNFRINHPMPEYADGRLLVRDHFQMGAGLALLRPDGSLPESGAAYTGNMEIRNSAGNTVYTISAATAFEQGNIKKSLKMLEYHINRNIVDISLPGDFLNRPASAYPVVIDPLVSQSSSTAVTGSTYSSSWSTPCVYANAATVPAKITVTDVQFSFQYVTSGGALLENGAFDFKLGSCKSPTPSGLFWNCNSTLTGTCTGTGASIFSSISACMPGPSCSSYNLDLTMDFYQNYATDVPCGTAYISSGTPLVITVFGHTVESNSITASASNLCLGQSATLTTSSGMGVPPYSYVWMPGSISGTTITVSPSVTTTYTVTSTDACGDAATASKTITVSPPSIIDGASSLCAGAFATLTNTVPGGTWASSNTAVATIGSSSGIVNGVAAGSATISYTTPAGCTAAAGITILALPANITGAAAICQSTTTTLSDATSGGTWASSNAGVATINSATGLLSGVASGTTVITYTGATGCTAVLTETVNPVAPVTGPSTECVGGSTPLSDAIGGGTWSSSATSIAIINAASGLMTGISSGTAIISYTTPAGCLSTASETVSILTPITGSSSVCQGSSSTLADATTGGSWMSSRTAIATVGATSGDLTGINAGTTTITYTAPGGCYTSAVITINPLGVITGPAAVCTGNNISLSDPTAGGTWTSNNTSVATVNSTSGQVSGVTSGAAIISFTTPAGCIATANETVLAPPPAITGATSSCQGNAVTLSDAATGGAWASSTPSVATIGAATGIVSAIASGTATITYSNAGGCYTTLSFSVSPLSPISGAPAVCVGNTTSLGNPISGGTWSSSNASIASVTASSGTVGGISGGTAAISYATPAGCVSVITVTVNSLNPITGTLSVCEGSTTTLTNATTGGTWSSSAPLTAPVSATSGIVAGVASGTATITYTAPGGCYVTSIVTVKPLTNITGTTTMCLGSSSTLSDATGGGTWSTTNAAIASIGVSSGVLAGVAPGTTTIRYTTSLGCTASATALINALSPIVGATSVCQGNTTTYTDPVTGGTWASTNPGIATINAASGIVSGIAAGTCNISYTNAFGCIAINEITVNAMAPITGTTSLCAGNATVLNNAVPGGTWSSLNPGVAGVVISSGALTGVSAGSATIDYQTPSGCVSSLTVTINAHAAVTGPTVVCLGRTITLSNAVPGGAWTSTLPAVASVGAGTGIVSGVAPGTSSISYTTTAGCTSVALVSVEPVYSITGAANLCVGNSATLADIATGGTWASSNASIAGIDPISGIANGVSAGNAIISYTTSAGCLATTSLTVNAVYPVSGATSVCQGYTIALTDAATGGTWASSDPGIAPIGISSGIVSGLAPGTAAITYTTPANCNSSTIVTIYPLSGISGNAAVCVGSTTTLTDGTAGGAWTSASPLVASINPATGAATGIAAGVALITYTTPAGCIATLNLVVYTLPGAITGSNSICVGSNETLGNTLPGGTWTSGNTTVATIGLSSGLLTGVAANTVAITYTTGGGCSETTTITVNPLPAPISGTSSLCQGSSTTLADITTGGSWSSSNTAVATIGRTSGSLNAVNAGVATITYTNTENCITSIPVTVYPQPSAILGTPMVCQGSSTSLSNPLPGGNWSSTNSAVASIGSGTGAMTGIAAGTAIISYVTEFGCYTTIAAIVNPTPVITGTLLSNPTTCQSTDGTITLTGLDAGVSYTVNYTGGASLHTFTLTADGSGNIALNGLAAGIYTNFSVTTVAGCVSNVITGPVTLTLPLAPPSPTAGNNTPVCDGSAISFTATDGVAGVSYSWSGPAGFASTLQDPSLSASTLSNNGVYSVTATRLGCVSAAATTTVVIHTIPVITHLTYTNPSTCQGKDGSITLSGLVAGEAYTVNYTDNGSPLSITITANAAGDIIITSLSAGTYADITVSSFTCLSNVAGPAILIDPVAGPAPVISSNSPICTGKTLRLTSSDNQSGLVYDWEGPNGFTSSLSEPEIPNISFDDSGAYTLTVRHLNCPGAASLMVHVYPPVTLTDVTPSQAISLGGSVELFASGAEYYLWSPNDGSIINPDTSFTTATPQQTTIYTVQGMNQWGCIDSAQVTISVNDYTNEFVPSAFSPNNDGLNDVFKIGNCQFDKLLTFNIYNRWGQLIYHNDSDPNQGWDGTFKGVAQDMGTYNYFITLSTPDGKIKNFKGEVVLIR